MFEKVRTSSLKLLYRKYKEIREENLKSNSLKPPNFINRISDDDHNEQTHDDVQKMIK